MSSMRKTVCCVSALRHGRALVCLWVLCTVTAAFANPGRRVLVDPPPEPSGGSGVEAAPVGERIWVDLEELKDFVPGEPPPLLQSDPVIREEEPAEPRTPPRAISWNGIIDSPATWIPPDTHIAVGPNVGTAGRVVMVTNGGVQIWDKTGTSIAGPIPLGAMFTAMPGNFMFDPKVLYDQHSGRFFIVALDGSTPGSSWIHLAVSTSSTPNNLTNNWTFLVGSGTKNIGGVLTWADYPGIGADANALFVTTNQFNAANAFTGSNIRVFNKAQLLAGVYAFVDITYNAASIQGIFTIQPAHVYGSTDNGGFYLISRWSSAAYRLFKITGHPAVPVVTTGMFAWSAGAYPVDTTADQCMVATPDLDTLSSRIQNAVYRNGHLWCCLTADPDNDGRTEVVWQDIRTRSYPNASPAVYQSGFINGMTGSGIWTYMPSINVNAAGDAAICFTQSSPTRCPDVSYVMRSAADPLGTFQAPVTALLSAGYYDSWWTAPPPQDRDRWGDYSACVVDPTDDCFWIANEFANTSAPSNSTWGTFITGFCSTVACCFNRNVCADLSPAACTAASGTPRPSGSRCPTQGVQTAQHASGTVVHWTNPAIDCYKLTKSRGAGDCCHAHPDPGCSDPVCQSAVCAVDPTCEETPWDEDCARHARVLCDCQLEWECIQGFLVDAWMTSPQETGHDMCHRFGPEQPCSPPIPPDFFGLGSDPFEGEVCLEGRPLGETHYGYFEVADTLVERDDEPIGRCALTSGRHSVGAKTVALNLVSIAPITVTYSGGQDPESWDVAVTLSETTPSLGSVTATRTHCNGGTYTSVFNVQPKFTFTKVGDPGQVRVLDTGAAGICPVPLEQVESSWVADADPNLMLDSPYCTAFHPALLEAAPQGFGSCDCNGNGIRDDCDIAAGTSLDCQPNRVPDECDPDLDGDLRPDGCDNCPGDPNPLQEDTDGDLIGDACDLCPELAVLIEGDHDGDRVDDVGDNCPCVANAGQEDSDGDGWGDACDQYGDCDHDGHVDLKDFAAFSGCLIGPGAAPTAGCACFDIDADADVDLGDFSLFQMAFTD